MFNFRVKKGKVGDVYRSTNSKGELKFISREYMLEKIQKKARHQTMSKKMDVKSDIMTYLKRHFLEFHEDAYEDTDRITMVFRNCEQCPDKVAEGCIYLYQDFMEYRVYYSAAGAEWLANSIHQSEFFRLLNYINAKVWPCGNDGVDGALYKSTNLYTPHLYMTEDDRHDITMTGIIPYDFFEVAPLETEDFLTASLPELMNALSPAIFLLLLGEIDLSQAKGIVDRDVLGEE